MRERSREHRERPRSGAPEVSARASQVAARPEVRSHLVALQRDMIRTSDYVAEGRDIGTVVAPEGVANQPRQPRVIRHTPVP